jgi:hypothetical protein
VGRGAAVTGLFVGAGERGSVDEKSHCECEGGLEIIKLSWLLVLRQWWLYNALCWRRDSRLIPRWICGCVVYSGEQ